MARGKIAQTHIPGVGFIFRPSYNDKKTGQTKRSGIWHMEYQTDDGPVRRSTKQRDQSAAFAELVRIAGERVTGQIQDSGPERVTFAELFRLVVADYKSRGLSSISQLKDRIRKHLTPAFGDMKVISLRKSDVDRFKSRASKKLSVATINRCLAILRRSLQLGAEHDPPLVIRAIPGWFKAEEEDNARSGIVSEETYRAVMPHMAPHVRTAWCIGYHVGMRSGEILSLRWEQVDLKAGLIRLERKQTKGRKARSAPIYGDMRAMLEMAQSANPPGCEYVVQEDGRRVFSIKTAFAAAWKRAEMLVDTGRLRKDGTKLLKPPVLFHDLRRTAATNMIRANVPTAIILLTVGWKSPAMLKRYGILEEADTVQVGRQMEAHWAQRRETGKEAERRTM